MGTPSKHLRAFMEKYKIDSDEVWEVRAGGAWAIKHNALERVAGEQGIAFDVPQFAEKDGANKIVAMLIVGHKGDRMEWSVGEASPSNNKNAYCYAMAEKRGKDRVILKLLSAHGTVYSETEADEFAPKRQNPHVTRPEDIAPVVEYDEQGHPVDNIPLGHPDIVPMSKAQSRPEYAALQIEMRKNPTEPQLKAWAESVKDRLATLHPEWQETFRGFYREYRDQLRDERAA